MSTQRDHHDDEWVHEVEDRGGFVLDEQRDFDDDDFAHDVTYRRAPDMGAASFVTGRFAALLPSPRQDEELFLRPDPKAMPSYVPSGLPAEAPALEAKAEGSKDLVPTGPVPTVFVVNYHKVNPSFESAAASRDVFSKLKSALESIVDDYLCFPDWSIEAMAVVAAEEVYFSIQLLQNLDASTIHVEFNRREGDEFQFLEVADKIRKACSSIDLEVQEFPDLESISVDLLSSWSSSGELFPGSMTVDTDILLPLLEDITLEGMHPFTRFESAKQLKDLCQYKTNRDTLRSDSCKPALVEALRTMLSGKDEDLARFAVFIMLNFVRDGGIDFPSLAAILAAAEYKKPSTKNLYDNLKTQIQSASAAAAMTMKG
ncbi:hypothetical protein P43SY_003188 [Pythium insidiosum]|uniref:KA1 domain-containing protein n=1 Tax=Pythium insidiosum TaxID=114742 RepID=A0AAD5M0E9_PYTIN|nr:hypothetical protein P43SY_003188 [Pythium insidiosum]